MQTEINTEEEGLSQFNYKALSIVRYEIRHFLHFSEAAARSEGLEPQQHQILLAIQALDEHSPTIRQLADHLAVRHHSAVGLIDRLEKKGLVKRIRGGADRRQVRVRITPDGVLKVRRLARMHREELQHRPLS